jgi:hypothetical protein
MVAGKRKRRARLIAPPEININKPKKCKKEGLPTRLAQSLKAKEKTNRRHKNKAHKWQNSTGSPHSDACEVPIYKPNLIGSSDSSRRNC